MPGPFALHDRRILVTGAASGIGAATAVMCRALGATTVVADRDAIDPAAGDAVYRLDVTDRAAVEAMVATSQPLDGLVVAAGLCPWEDWNEAGWDASFDRVIDVNLKAAMHACRAVLPGMVARGFGRIVLVTSLAGRSGGLIAGPHYVASKGALHAFVRWLAQQGGPSGVTANAVAPASIATPMMAGRPVDTARIPLRRTGRPDEVAGPIAFLLSDASSYVTGCVLDVNGGVWMG